MKILFAIQGTGNGHISRAREIVPLLQKHGELDLLVSGTEAEMALSQPLKYRFHGFSFVFGNRGGIDKWATYQRMNLPQLIKDVRSLPLKEYDLIVNDFEPVAAWACRLSGIKCVSLSHQCSFVSKKTPRPSKWSPAEVLLKYYSPTNYHIGFHFDRYDDFIHTPVIRSEIRHTATQNLGHYAVYLPAYDDKVLVKILSQIDVPWQVFSKRQKVTYQQGNVQVNPVNNEGFNSSLANCEGLLTGGGFEGPAEALFLQKKVMMVPMTDQYEQQCNALAAQKMGVPVLSEINQQAIEQIKRWVYSNDRVKVNFPDETATIVTDMVNRYARR
jgi:uncharacterized protein (TIGR00661 family)